MHEYESSTHLKIAWSTVFTLVTTMALLALTARNALLYGATDGFTLAGGVFCFAFVIFAAAARTSVRDRVASRRSNYPGLPFIGEQNFFCATDRDPEDNRAV